MRQNYPEDTSPMQDMLSYVGAPLSKRSSKELVRYAEEVSVDTMKEMIDFNSYSLVAESCVIRHHSYSQLCQKLAELDPACAEQYAAFNIAHGRNAFEIVKQGPERRRR